MRRRRPLLLAGALVLVLLVGALVVAALGGSGGSRPSAGPSPSAGAPARRVELPSVTLPGLGSSAPVRIAGVRGPAVIDLWASWCKPCREELPLVRRLHAAAGRRLRVLGVCSIDRSADCRRFLQQHGAGLPTVLDEDGLVFRSTGSPGLPTLLFVRGGTVVHVAVGGVHSLAALEGLVRSRLGVRV